MGGNVSQSDAIVPTNTNDTPCPSCAGIFFLLFLLMSPKSMKDAEDRLKVLELAGKETCRGIASKVNRSLKFVNSVACFCLLLSI